MNLQSPILVAALLSCALNACSDVTAPRVDPSLRPILFIGRGAAGPFVFAVRGDGSDLHRISSATQGELYPAWSRDSRSIAFTRDQSVFVMDASGQNVRQASTQLPLCPYIYDSPTWSQDGMELAVECPGIATYVVSLTTGAFVSLVDSLGIAGALPKWSADGKLLIVTGPAQPRDMPLTTPDGQQILVRVFTGGAAPAWSPDSHQIAYEGSYGATTAIFVAAADGSSPRRITSPSLVQADDQQDEAPTWSADGKWIAFHRRSILCVPPVPPATSNCKSHWTLYVTSVDGSQLRRLTPDSLEATHPNWY